MAHISRRATLRVWLQERDARRVLDSPSGPMASPQPRKRARTTRASRRAATFELLGDGTARASLSTEDARKCSVLANASGEYRCAGQSQASLDAIKRFLAACDDDGEVSSSPLSRADADVCLRCCEAGAALESMEACAAEACVFGAWACTELGWRDDAIVERFSNGDLRVVAKRPIIVD